MFYVIVILSLIDFKSSHYSTTVIDPKLDENYETLILVLFAKSEIVIFSDS